MPQEVHQRVHQGARELSDGIRSMFDAEDSSSTCVQSRSEERKPNRVTCIPVCRVRIA